MDMCKIIVVDDDTIVTSAFKTLFKVEGFTDVHLFNDPKKALLFLNEEIPDLIISDFLMPEMNGLEFLSEAKKLHPEVSMILLTGYADKENAIKAINEIGLYKYIEKPWDNDDLLMNIKNGVERSHLLSELRQKIKELENTKKELEKYSHNLEDLVHERTKELSLSNSKLTSIIQYCADGIIIMDEEGFIIQANPTSENLFGLDEKRLIDKNFSKLAQGKENFKKELAENSEVFLRDFVIKNELSNSQTPVDISFALINQGEKTRKFVGVIRDISVQKETERLRDDFIATLTHDLRTPLLAAIQTLRFFIDGTLGELTEKQRVLLSTMEKSNGDLLGLVNALLEVYKYESGKLTLCKTNFNINELVKQCYNELKPLSDKKNINFKIDYDIENEIIINADRGEIRRVITNLCGNAVNYTNKDGEINISLKCENKDIIFSVSDNGNGIPQEDIPHLFMRFSQGTSKKRSTGTGLGLYLSREIIEAHGGKIWLESKINKGSEFSFLLTNVVNTKNVKVEKVGK